MSTGRANVEAITGLTPMQEGILFHALHAPESGLYVEQFSCVLEGPLDVERWQAAWGLAIERHGALRTLFTWKKRDKPLQVVRRHVEAEWQVGDWTGEADAGAALREFLGHDRGRGFTLERAPLSRFAIFSLSPNRHQFVWTFHHIVLDGWSMRLVLSDVLTLYHTPSGTADPPPPFQEFVSWLASRHHDATAAYWSNSLAGFTTPTPLEFEPSASRWAEHHDTLDTHLGPEVSAALAATARDCRVTLNTVFRGAWAVMLSRYTGEDDVVFGVTVSGRSHELPRAEERVGLFINTVPVRAAVTADMPVREWLAGLHRDQLAAGPHEHASLAAVQRASGVTGPLFQTLLVFENQPGAHATGGTIRIADPEYVEQSNFPLALLVVPGADIHLITVFDRDRYARRDIECVMEQFAALLAEFAAKSDAPLRDLSLLTGTERNRVTVEWNPAPVDIADAETVVERIASRPPDAVAIRCGEVTMSYAELHMRADAVAARLSSLGVTRGERVAISLERSAEMVVGILGILRAGAPYVPIDPLAPASRIQFILDDTQARALVVTRDLSLSDSVPRVVVDVSTPVGSEPVTAATVRADDAAYVIYTSGSTGRPKGVEVTHRNLVQSTCARFSVYPGRAERFALVSPFVFDSSVAGIFWTLADGGTLVLPAPGVERDIPALRELFARERVTHTLMLPALYSLFLEHASDADLAALEIVVLAGEACPPDVVAAHLDRLPNARLFNEYGPTEATVWATVHEMTQAEPRIPIGRPIPGMQAFILDAGGHPLPARVPGELVLAGHGIARGYVNRPGQTDEKFVALPFEDGTVRAYRTGDRARFRDDGTIEFLGRVDRQVKIRGHRVELDEIEAVVRAAESVRDAAVVLNDDGPRPRLIAYIEAEDPAAADTVSAHVATALPDYMRPSIVQIVDVLPRTATGKVNRRALPAPDAAPGNDAGGGVENAAPENAVQAALAAIWADVLGVDAVGIHDDFFRLGGDSLLSIRIIARAHEAGIRVTPKQFFDHPTVADLAAVAEGTTAEPVDTGPVVGPVPLTPVQHWFFRHITADPHQWNQAAWFEVESPDVEALQRAVDAIVEHHDALRLRVSGDHVAECAPPSDRIRVETATSGDDERTEADAHAALDLEHGPLVRVIVAGPRVLIVAHHLVVDEMSWSILADDLGHAYEAARRGDAIALPSKSASIAVWGRALVARADAPEVIATKDKWVTVDAAPPLPLDTVALDDNRHETARTIETELDPATTGTLLRDAPAAGRARISDLLLAAFTLAISDWTGDDHVRLDVEGHGRDADGIDLDVSRTVGWFTTIHPVALRRENDAAGTLVATKEALRAAPPAATFGLLRYLNSSDAIREAFDAAPRPELAFNYLGQRSAAPAGSFTRVAGAAAGARSPRAPRPYILDVNAWVADDSLHVHWTYSDALHRTDTIEGVAAGYIAALKQVIEVCVSGGAAAAPSDFPLADLDAEELKRLGRMIDRTEDGS